MSSFEITVLIIVWSGTILAGVAGKAPLSEMRMSVEGDGRRMYYRWYWWSVLLLAAATAFIAFN